MEERILKVIYCITSDTTAIYYTSKKRTNSKIEEKIKLINGRIDFKGKNPTEYELLKIIELKGGFKE